MSDSGASAAKGDIVALDATALSNAIHARKLSCAEVMAAYLDQIDRLNPIVNALVALRERSDLLKEAAALDAELDAGRSRGWMHGFPQAIKDLAAAKGFATTQGSPLFKDTIAEADAIFVARMKAAGAIIVGKSNTPEFGLGSQTFNPVYGPTRNAYDQSRTSGGSSGGAAVALALRMLPVADGSDHAGSLRNPAAFNNVLGLRPAYGRVPSGTEEVFIPQLGVAGPMARKTRDLAALLAVQSGYDPRVPLSLREEPAGFLGSLNRDITGLRIGWLGDLGGHLPIEDGILPLCRTALAAFEGMGASVEEVALGFDPELVWQAWLKLRAWQVGANLAPIYEDPTRRDHLKPEARWEVEQGLKLSAFDVMKASNLRSAWYQHVLGLFQRFDVLVLPSAQVFPFAVETHWPKEITGRAMDTYHRWMEVVIPVTMSGCPALNVPVGFSDAGLPMGMQLWGPNQSERLLLELGQAYEDATGWVEKRKPVLLAG
ncbi:amidase [Bosea caraganae]|uniref:Indoleacetamide hydrolase n=1 Tax=Bosea caraganae TaxID=2763117 RepID=A0A370L3S6_9HYPH|nr:amidase [Bosea caraganae]RDJ23094.1 amidase [Bosea caraganae]RDJ28874.1 amidase [Bosea caraganae]